MSKFLKGSLLYFLGNSLSKVVAFFLLPIYSKFISPDDFGYFDLCQSYLYLLIPIITFECYLGVLRFLKESDSKNINQLITTGFSTLVVFLILIVITFLFPDFFHGVKKLTLILILFVVLVLQKYYSSICRGLNNNRLFVITGIFSSFLVAISNYIMIIYYNIKLDSLFWSAIIGFSYQIIHLEFKLKLRYHIQISEFDYVLFKKLIIFSFPISIGSILFYFLNSYNRILIENKMGLAVNGFYAIASKFSLMITFLTSAFTMAWQDYSFSVNNDNGNRELFTKGIDLFYKFLILGGSMFILVIPYFFNYVIDSKYSESYNLIALCIGVTLFSSVGDFLSQTFLALKKTNLIIYTSFFITIFCVIFSPIFVNLFGVNGVNFTLIIAYFFNFLWRLLYLKKLFKYNFNFILYFALMIYFFLVCYIYKVNVPLINLSSLIITLLLFYYFFRQEIINILKSTIRR